MVKRNLTCNQLNTKFEKSHLLILLRGSNRPSVTPRPNWQAQGPAPPEMLQGEATATEEHCGAQGADMGSRYGWKTTAEKPWHPYLLVFTLWSLTPQHEAAAVLHCVFTGRRRYLFERACLSHGGDMETVEQERIQSHLSPHKYVPLVNNREETQMRLQ